MSVLVTGGTGYIGSHTVLTLLESGYEVIIVDNLSNSRRCVLDRIETITGKRPVFYQVDLLDASGLEQVFAAHPTIDSVIHFAGLKAVGESVRLPLTYYHNNLTGTLILLQLMQAHGVGRLVFSSSATVYGSPDEVPIRETAPLRATNPYGATKLMIEQMLADACVSRPQLSASVLRYFNPIGAHHSGLIGEDPLGIPNNLLPFITKVAIGKQSVLRVFGNDYPTPDGTGVRDYIHVADLAEAHLCALRRTAKVQGRECINIGTGNGYSVLEIVAAFEKHWGAPIPYEIAPRREGDIAVCYADPTLARELLGWTPRYGLDDMCRDLIRWVRQNPDGYPDA
ncbi:MAG: UDP-glucose 4-epimerase GalE [Eubacteriales bacterium]